MGVNLKNIKCNVPKAVLEDYSIMCYGRPKSGKTTLFAKLVKEFYGDVSKGLLLAFEQGYNALEVVAQPINTFDEFIEADDQLISQKEELGFKFIGIDTVDELYRMAVNYVLKRESRKDGKKYVALGDIPYGKAYEMVEMAIMEQLIKLKRAGYGLFFVSHDKNKKFESRDGVSYDQTTLSLPDRIRNSVLNMVDFVNFIDIAKEKDEVSGKLVDKRYIYFRADGSDLEAGSRFENCPSKIPYDVATYIETFENAVNSALNGKDVKKVKAQQIKEREEKAKDFREQEALPSNDELINKIKEYVVGANPENQTRVTNLLAEKGISSLKEPDKLDKKVLMEVVELL